ncbi:MAG: DUF4258 domain-containing protein [Candidatus Glassbacteria bacterium]|nr:DUF4258 domain-containing protein [Candidatus Glassbacteria bacterium]
MSYVFDNILFSGHALRRMFQRGVTKDRVIKAIKHGEVIAEYPEDTPYPSKLILGFVNKSPLHVVFAEDKETNTGIVVTAYVPDASLWGEDYKSRRGL